MAKKRKLEMNSSPAKNTSSRPSIVVDEVHYFKQAV
jgi:hypothetical protein